MCIKISWGDFMNYKVFFWLFIALVLIIVAVPILYVGYEGSIGRYSNPQLSLSQDVIRSIVLTLVSSAIATLIALVLGIPVAYYLARYDFKGKGVVEALVDLPASVPHPLIGVAILLLFSEPLSPALQLLGVESISYTFYALVLALLIVSSPIMIRTMVNNFKAMDPEPEIAALSLGVSRVRVFFLITLPMSIRAILNSYAITFARAVSEFGSVSIVAYYIINPPFQGTKQASVLIWDLFESGGLGKALPVSATLLAISLLVLAVIRITEAKQ